MTVIRRAHPISDADRSLLVEGTGGLSPSLSAARIFLTGGTGFVGTWLLEAMTAASDECGLDLHVTVLTRRPDVFAARCPWLAAHGCVTLLAGDARSFDPPREPPTAVISGAVDSSRPATEAETLETIVEDTRRCVALAASSRARLLLVSSGAAYSTGPAPPDSAYTRGKRAAEGLALAAWRERDLPVVIARPFAFVGPHLRLDAHYAIGNFIRDALSGGPVRVRGDGAAVRSYLYAADLAVWLLAILARGRPGAAYDVGSEDAISIANLARRVAAVVAPDAEVRVEGAASTPSRYVPDTARTRDELSVAQRVGLDDAIARTAAWYSGKLP